MFDDGFDCRAFRDADGDFFGNPSDFLLTCNPPAGYVFASRDCNDNNPAINPVQTDLPDSAFVDANCDGLDGEVNGAVFVDAVSGNDGNDGTMSAPKRTILASIATASGTSRDIYVAAGTYAEQVTLFSDVSVFGGYARASPRWTRSAANVTSISSPTAIGILAANLALPTEIQLLRIASSGASGQSPAGDGRSSTAVLVVNSPSVTIRDCLVLAGNGSAATDAPIGSSGAPGGPGGGASGTTAGPAGISSCGAPGGQGAPGVSGATGGIPGSAGVQAMGGGPSGSGGGPGSSGTCSSTSSSNGGGATFVSSVAGIGAAGSGGNPGSAAGTFSSSGAYDPPVGSPGSIGRAGGGAGGGGSGGGSASGTNFLCTNCSALASGGGGGGGGGGCGGNGGPAARGGGGSFGIVSRASGVFVFTTEVRTGNGGGGGRGGNGGVAGDGGAAGTGAAGQIRNNGCSVRSAGDGASGAVGASGGRGGGGAGGAGGPSVCIAYQGGTPSTAGVTCIFGGGGAGGIGGSNGSSNATRGPDGLQGDVRAFQ